ncbi:hypothetical protein ACIG5D_04060 [Microbispora rosea]
MIIGVTAAAYEAEFDHWHAPEGGASWDPPLTRDARKRRTPE